MNIKSFTKMSIIFAFCLVWFNVDAAIITQLFRANSEEGNQSSTSAIGGILVNFTSSDKVEETWNKQEKPLKGVDRVCPSGSSKVDDLLNERAVCPWHVKESYDENRYPTIIKEAVCLCKECLKVGHCVASYANVPTWRKSKGGNFVLETLKVAVACNCVLGQRRVQN